jgi:hypothetical protein
LLLASGSVHAQEFKNTFRGTIQTVEDGRILIDQTALVWITKETKIYKLEGKKRVVAKSEDLRNGQKVTASYSCEVRNSDPPQVDADEIVIVAEPHIRGVILETRKIPDALGSYLVEGRIDKQKDRLWVHVSKETKIFTSNYGQRKAARIEDLKDGVRVEVFSTGEVALSDPGQISAVEIVILATKEK